jgi:uracil-DNA glycosylase family 4
MPSIEAGTDSALLVLNNKIVDCRRCARLVEHREAIGRVQRRAYRGELYWSKPVPGFGDPLARLLIIGLAPGAHGANRTGRVFTGDRSGDFLYGALCGAGFANQPESFSREDGLSLTDCYITCPVRCVPPDNKPALAEMLQCRPFLMSELKLLTRVQVVVVLGAIALESYLSVLKDSGLIRSRAGFRFAHGATFRPHPATPVVLTSYHPSQQNTSTKRLTREMLLDIFIKSRRLFDQASSAAEPLRM